MEEAIEKVYFSHERRMLEDLKASGFSPKVIYDIGAGAGSWSEEISNIFPRAQYHLFEPLADIFEGFKSALASRLEKNPNFKLHRIALCDRNGKIPMSLFRNGYSSSLHDVGNHPELDKRIVAEGRRLDDYVSEHELPLPDLIKLDTQGTEDVILRGGLKSLEHARVVQAETWFKRGYGPRNPLLYEIVDLLKQHGFSLVELGEKFYDDQHRLESIDAFFVADSLKAPLWRRTQGPPVEEWHVPVMDLDTQLGRLLESGADLADLETSPGFENSATALKDADVIISHSEINERHGTGVLIGRLFEDQRNIISIRSHDLYGGEHEFGAFSVCLSHGNVTRDRVVSGILRAMGQTSVRRILCVPYYPDDLRTAIAMKDIYGAPMCTYLMDDQNVSVNAIPDDLLRETLEKSALRLAISPELVTAYEKKFGLPIFYLPPTAPGRLIPSKVCVPDTAPVSRHGVVLGNIWGRHWLHLLRGVTRNSGVVLSWYSNGGCVEHGASEEALIADSIYPFGSVPEEELIRILRQMWFAVLPSGTLDAKDDRLPVAKLSLPSRLIYLMAVAQIPVLVLGNPETSAARFVRQFGIGLCADYDRRSFVDTVNQISKKDVNLDMRKRALAIAGRFTDAGISEWIRQSLDKGAPIDGRFSDLMPQ